MPTSIPTLPAIVGKLESKKKNSPDGSETTIPITYSSMEPLNPILEQQVQVELFMLPVVVS